MQLIPYLAFNGECDAAFKFYQQCFGGNIQTLMTYGESPMADQVPPEWRDRIIHASLAVGEAALLGADAPPDRDVKPTGFCVSIQINDAEEAGRIFNALADNGTIQMPLQETFWAVRFGMVTDRFSTPWMINCGQAE